jgi:hypothetical protein
MEQHTKLCPRCNQVKPWVEFYIQRNRNRPGPYCKICCASYKQTRYVPNTPNHAATCKQCGGPITPRRSNRPVLFCSKQCRQSWHNWKPGAAERRREATRRSAHGVSGEEYARRLADQDGKCRLCGTPEAESRHGVLDVDHCHTSGRIRGLLCHRCNWALGLLGDDPALLRCAAEYLEVQERTPA